MYNIIILINKNNNNIIQTQVFAKNKILCSCKCNIPRRLVFVKMKLFILLNKIILHEDLCL